MRILITNDDGIYAEGIMILATSLCKIAEVSVVAPMYEQSGSGHGITVHTPLRMRPLEQSHDWRSWVVQGLPTDCVKLAIEQILDDKPDIVVSGINHGPNLGTDIIYSGTVSGAIEGYLYGIPSIAVSITEHKGDFAYAAGFVRDLCCKWQKNMPANPIMYNINVPSGGREVIKGVRCTQMGRRWYNNVFELREDPHGRPYYWLSGDVDNSGNDKETDVWAINNNFISITPLTADLTDYKILSSLKEQNFTF